MQALLAVVLLVGFGAGAGAYSGVFYVTGSQFYEACRQRQAKEKIELMVVLKTPKQTIEAKLFSGAAALLS